VSPGPADGLAVVPVVATATKPRVSIGPSACWMLRKSFVSTAVQATPSADEITAWPEWSVARNGYTSTTRASLASAARSPEGT
jgi:hypothetical protein